VPRPTPGRLSGLLCWVAEEAIEPDFPIVDCHHHLWDTPGAGRPGSAPPPPPTADGLPTLSQVHRRGHGGRKVILHCNFLSLKMTLKALTLNDH
jgi:hypothetical protein